MRTTLVVTTYNRKDALALVLESALRQSRRPDELIVADDGSRPDTAEVVAAFAARAPFPVRHSWQEDLGFRVAASRNRAIAMATGDYLVMLDGDIVMHRHFLDDHLRAAQPGWYVQGSRVMLSAEATARALATGRISFGPLARGLGNRINAVHSRALSRLVSYFGTDVFRIRAANMACWREDVLRVNGFDEDFVGWGAEDSDFVGRLQHAGVARVHLKFAAIGYHLWHRHESRASMPENERKVAETLASGKVRCANGLDKYLA